MRNLNPFRKKLTDDEVKDIIYVFRDFAEDIGLYRTYEEGYPSPESFEYIVEIGYDRVSFRVWVGMDIPKNKENEVETGLNNLIDRFKKMGFYSNKITEVEAVEVYFKITCMGEWSGEDYRKKLDEEVKLRDVAKLSGNIGTEIIDPIDFDFSKNLVKFLTLQKRIGKNKIRMEIDWYDKAVHNIQERIKNRTSFKSIEEFNQRLKYILNRIFPEMIGKEVLSNGRYSIYDMDNNISILFDINVDNWLLERHKIKIITILPGRKGLDVVRIIDII